MSGAPLSDFGAIYLIIVIHPRGVRSCFLRSQQLVAEVKGHVYFSKVNGTLTFPGFGEFDFEAGDLLPQVLGDEQCKLFNQSGLPVRTSLLLPRCLKVGRYINFEASFGLGTPSNTILIKSGFWYCLLESASSASSVAPLLSHSLDVPHNSSGNYQYPPSVTSTLPPPLFGASLAPPGSDARLPQSIVASSAHLANSPRIADSPSQPFPTIVASSRGAVGEHTDTGHTDEQLSDSNKSVVVDSSANIVSKTEEKWERQCRKQFGYLFSTQCTPLFCIAQEKCIWSSVPFAVTFRGWEDRYNSLLASYPSEFYLPSNVARLIKKPSERETNKGPLSPELLFYKFDVKSEIDLSTVLRANKSFPFSRCGVSYFEVKILALSFCVSVGLVNQHAQIGRTSTYIGWDKNGFAWHGDDGKATNGISAGDVVDDYGPPWETGDVIGCGILWAESTIFFTRNGTFCGEAFKCVNSVPLFPAIGLHKPQDKAQINFGHGYIPSLAKYDDKEHDGGLQGSFGSVEGGEAFQFDLARFVRENAHKVASVAEMQEVVIDPLKDRDVLKNKTYEFLLDNTSFGFTKHDPVDWYSNEMLFSRPALNRSMIGTLKKLEEFDSGKRHFASMEHLFAAVIMADIDDSMKIIGIDTDSTIKR